jgi:hypothetical protein
MKTNVQLKNFAIALRKEGKSYNEILNEVPVAKSTLSVWLRDLPLSKEQNENLEGRLKERKDRGRLKTGIALTARRLAREGITYSEAQKEFEKHIKGPFFVAGILLYWAEGAKKNNYFAFVNSDPAMVSLVVNWLRRFFPKESKLLKYRLFIHLPYKNENCEEFWGKVLGVEASTFYKTIYKPTSYVVKKNPSYKGCIRLTITRIDVLRKMIAWQKLLIQYYKEVVV